MLIIRNSTFRLLLLASLLLTTACRLQITVPPGGRVVGEDGFVCNEGAICTVKVTGTDFSQVFSAEPIQGGQFQGWKRAEKHFCGDLMGACLLSAGELADFPSLMAIISGNKNYYLEPAFRPEYARIYVDMENRTLHRANDAGVSSLVPNPVDMELDVDQPIIVSPARRSALVRYLGKDRESYLGIYDLYSGELLNPIPVNSGDLQDLARAGAVSSRFSEGYVLGWSIDEKTVIFAEKNIDAQRFEVSAWDGTTHQLLYTVPAWDNRYANPLIYSKRSFDGRYLATSFAENDGGYQNAPGTLFIWDLVRLRQLLRVEGVDRDDWFYPRWSPKKPFLVYQPLSEGYPYGDTLLYDARNASIRTILAWENPYKALEFQTWLGGARMLLAASPEINQYPWQVRNYLGELIVERNSHGFVVPSPKDNALAYMDNENAVYVINLRNLEEVTIGSGHWMRSYYESDDWSASKFKWSPDSRYLAWDYYTGEEKPGYDGVNPDDWVLSVYDRRSGAVRELTRKLLHSNKFMWETETDDTYLRFEQLTADGESEIMAYQTSTGTVIALPADPDNLAIP